jgi:PAS domain S-box-containing protein
MTRKPSKPIKKKTKTKKTTSLRKRAEGMLVKQKERLRELSSTALKKLVHELGTYQIELEMQNEDLRHAYAEIESSRRKYADLYDFSPVGYFTFDKNGLIQEVNHTGAGMLSMAKRFLLGKPFQIFIEPDGRAAFRGHLAEVFRTQTRQTCEVNLRRKDGILFPAQLQSIGADSGEGATDSCRTAVSDISERKRIELSLQESEEKFRTLFESASDALFIIDMQGNILDANTIAYEQLGYTKDDLLRLPLSKLVDPSFVSLLQERMTRIKKYGYMTVESAHLRKNGSSMPVEFNATVTDLHGKPVIFSVVRDITERKRSEFALQDKTRQLEDLTKNLEKRVKEEIAVRTRSEQMMIQQSKLAAMGEMLGAIAHQWRQPLNVVGLIVQNFQEAFEKGKLDEAYITDMVKKGMVHIERMSTTIDDFRNFYKSDKEKKVFDVMKAVGDVLNLFSAQLSSENITYRLTCHTHGKTFENEADIAICAEKTVEGFENEFEHVVLNLISNARDAIIERRVRDGKGATGEGLLSFDFYNTSDAVVIKISDNGCGIPTNVADRIFQPYFTTKEGGQGTGLGLYMSKVMVEDHMKGKLSAGNNEQGAIFTIELPRPGKELHRERAETI